MYFYIWILFSQMIIKWNYNNRVYNLINNKQDKYKSKLK